MPEFGKYSNKLFKIVNTKKNSYSNKSTDLYHPNVDQIPSVQAFNYGTICQFNNWNKVFQVLFVTYTISMICQLRQINERKLQFHFSMSTIQNHF